MGYTHEGQQITYQNDAGETLGYLKYSVNEEHQLLQANSTFVDPSLRGQGVAYQLVERLADYARQEGYKIRPVCSYVVQLFDRVDDFDDVKF